jgi:hypothetical protein
MGAPTRRQGLARAAIVVAGAAAFTAVWLLPEPSFGNPIAPMMQISRWSQNSLAHLLKRLLLKGSGLDRYVVPIFTVGMAVVFSRNLGWTRDRATFLQRLSRDYLLYLTIFGQLFHPWYVVPALVLSSVSDNSRHRTATLWLAGASLALIRARQMLPVFSPAGQAVQFATVLLPAAILLLAPRSRRFRVLG